MVWEAEDRAPDANCARAPPLASLSPPRSLARKTNEKPLFETIPFQSPSLPRVRTSV